MSYQRLRKAVQNYKKFLRYANFFVIWFVDCVIFCSFVKINHM